MNFSYLESISPVLPADQGIPDKDLLSLLEYARIKGIILLFRPVESSAKSLHNRAQYPTKNFNIKGKSASWGPGMGSSVVSSKVMQSRFL
ncbi:anthrax toxin-like adenylyl cyclase domain-containing protein [Rickettsiella massiliensis]|uniref:anthrax toxin-like adenylyl cyclase domain-containing protein n=1 Tax=Rickettsiella massiliensis TaxID=676517 RepID=UPI0012E9E05F